MKNVHLIATPKPSRLWVTKLGNLTRCHDIKPIKETLGNNVNIYITDNSEIKEGDWYFDGLDFVYKKSIYNNSLVDGNKNAKKIILTTDQALIADGVQAIDDEFLEWFVKNPSCEEVEVIRDSRQSTNGNGFLYIEWLDYKIIIPKEEQKQALIDMMKLDEESGLYDETEHLLSTEANRNRLLCKDCNKSLEDCTCIEDTIEFPKNDTSKVTRVEVIQHSPPYNGRAFTKYNAKDVEIQFQDDGRTLKIFLK